MPSLLSFFFLLSFFPSPGSKRVNITEEHPSISTCCNHDKMVSWSHNGDAVTRIQWDTILILKDV